MESSSETLAKFALVKTTKVLALETDYGCAASWME